MLYAAPSNAPSMLVLDTATDTVDDVDTEDTHSGNQKWRSITAVGGKVSNDRVESGHFLTLFDTF